MLTISIILIVILSLWGLVEFINWVLNNYSVENKDGSLFIPKVWFSIYNYLYMITYPIRYPIYKYFLFYHLVDKYGKLLNPEFQGGIPWGNSVTYNSPVFIVGPQSFLYKGDNKFFKSSVMIAGPYYRTMYNIKDPDTLIPDGKAISTAYNTLNKPKNTVYKHGFFHWKGVSNTVFPGLNPAIWLMGHAPHSPECDIYFEIDVLENFNKDIQSTVHFSYKGVRYMLPFKPWFSNNSKAQNMDLSVLWESNKVVFFKDRVPYFKVTFKRALECAKWSYIVHSMNLESPVRVLKGTLDIREVLIQPKKVKNG